MTWEKKRADEFCESVKDGTHDTPKEVNCGFKLVTAKNIRNGQIFEKEAYNISEEDYIKINNRSKVEKWDVLMSMIGNGLGRSAVVKCDPEYAIKNLALFKIGNETKAKWLHYFLSSPEGQGMIFNSLQGSGQPFISLNLLRSFIIPIPSSSIMQKIVEILSVYDDLIENNQKEIKLLEEAAQRLYKEWFVDLRFPGYETTPIIDGVPEGWRKSFVGECAIILRRGISPAYHENGKFTVINQKCIRQTVVDFAEARKQEKAYSDDLNLLDSDTVICSTGAGTLGRVGQIFGNHPKTTFDSHITLVRANEMIGKQYLFHVLKSYQNYLMGMGKGSTNQLELSRNTIQELTVYVPTFELKIKFEALVQPIHDKISLLNKKIKYLYEARDRLLPKLMSGELEV